MYTLRRTVAVGLAVILPALVLAAAPVGSGTAYAKASLQNDEYWLRGWALDEVWRTSRGAGVTVAVLDTGVTADLPDLAGAVTAGGDVTGNGTDGRTDLDLDLGHGTAMAALIAGRGKDKLIGVAPQARILPVVVNSGFNDAASSYSAGIQFAVDHGADVINLSQAADGSDVPANCPPAVQQAVAYAVQHDVVVVAGAGNSGDTDNVPDYPAACAGVVAVGAVDRQGRPWSGTQNQPYVDVAGFGVGVVSVDALGDAVDGDGTSNASALVSAVVALIRSAHPDMGARQVVARLLASAHDVGPAGRDNLTGDGIVAPLTAVTSTRIPDDAANPVFDELDALNLPNSPPPSVPAATHVQGGSHPPPAVGSSPIQATTVLAVVAGVGGVLLAAVVVLLLLHRRRRGRRPTFPAPGPLPPAPSWPPPAPIPPAAPPSWQTAQASGQPQAWGAGWPPVNSGDQPWPAAPGGGPNPGAWPNPGTWPGPGPENQWPPHA